MGWGVCKDSVKTPCLPPYDKIVEGLIGYCWVYLVVHFSFSSEFQHIPDKGTVFKLYPYGMVVCFMRGGGQFRHQATGGTRPRQVD